MNFGIGVVLVFLCFNNSVLYVNSKHLETQNVTQNEDSIYKMYYDLDKTLKDLVSNVVKMGMPHFMKITEQVQLSSSCSRDVLRLISDTRKLKLSALKILDATAKVEQGALVGNIFLLGDYEECMTTSVMNKDGKEAFKGQYCRFELRPLLPKVDDSVTRMHGFKSLKDATRNTSELIQYIASTAHYFPHFPMKAGICLPSGCTSQDIDSLLKYVAENSIMRIKAQYCDREHYYASTSYGKFVALGFFTIFALLAIIGLALDLYSIPSKNSIVRFLLCFSIKKNFPLLVSLNVSNKSLAHVNGIRSLSVFYIILLHQYFFSERTSMIGHMKHATDNLSNFADQIYANGYLTSETFMFIGGFLNAYGRISISQKSKSGKTNYVLLVVHRLMRIYPAYITGLLSSYILSVSYGPVRTEVIQKYMEPCDRLWWRNLLFINNLFPQQDVCMVHGWYIAADIQLFLLSLFTISMFYRNPKRAIILHLVILVCGLISTAALSWYKDLVPGLININTEKINSTWNMYATPLPHIAPYFLGILIGYFLSVNKDFKIPLVCQILGWPAAGVALISMLFMTKYFDTGEVTPLYISVLYLTFSKLIYVTSVAWIIVCCSRGSGGVINYILSLKVWIPISKLSFLMYNLGPTVQLFYFANLPVRIDSHNITRIWQHIGDLGIIFLVALFLSSLIESPVFAIQKLIFNKRPAGENDGPVKGIKISMNGIEDKPKTAIELENHSENHQNKENLDLRDRLVKLI